jgi:signal transduction histidine kinase
MRHLLGLLHDADPQRPQRTPQPGLGDVRPLVERLRSTGVDVAFDEQDSGSVDLSPGVELTAFRIVQEGLTNALKHAPGASIGVSVLRSPSEVVVRVSDDGTRVPVAPAGVAGGRGLIGMRERIAVYSGDLQAGPLPEGGWCLVACVPVQPVR